MANYNNGRALLWRPIRQRGYTLAEVIVANGLLVLLSAIVLTGLLFVQRSSAARAVPQAGASRAIAILERDMDTVVGVEAIAADEWTLRVRNSTSNTIESLTYWFDSDNGDLMRIEVSTDSEQTLLKSLRTAQFRFYDHHAETTAPASVRRISFTGILERRPEKDR